MLLKMMYSILESERRPTSERRLRLAYLTDRSPFDMWSWSGIIAHTYAALETQGLQVSHVGKSIMPWNTRVPAPLGKVIRRLTPRQRSEAWTFAYGPRSAKAIERELSQAPYDVIFAPAASMIIAHLNTCVPIIYLSDTTARLMLGYYHDTHRHSSALRDYLEECEARTIARADRLIYFGHWAADSAIHDYGAPPSKVRVIPGGININPPKNIERVIASRSLDKCRLLFIGKDWHRKGGDIAVRTADALERLGVDATLNICSATISPEALRNPRVTYEGLLDKSKPSEAKRYETLLRRAHFLILPTRADCGSAACCEADTFAVPSIATRTGNMPMYVEDGVNGYLLPPSADGEEYAHLIAEIWNDRRRYLDLVHSTRRLNESRPSWDDWAAQVKALAIELADSGTTA